MVYYICIRTMKEKSIYASFLIRYEIVKFKLYNYGTIYLERKTRSIRFWDWCYVASRNEAY